MKLATAGQRLGEPGRARATARGLGAVSTATGHGTAVTRTVHPSVHRARNRANPGDVQSDCTARPLGTKWHFVNISVMDCPHLLGDTEAERSQN